VSTQDQYAPSSPRQQQVQVQYSQPQYSAGGGSSGVTVSNTGGTFGLNLSAGGGVSANIGGGSTDGLPHLSTICPGGEFVWALDTNGGVWRWNGAAFEKIPGKLRSLAVGSDGAVWGTDYQDNIYRRTQNGWQQVRGRLHSVAVGNQNNVWGITPDGATVRYLGGGQWEPVTQFLSSQ